MATIPNNSNLANYLHALSLKGVNFHEIPREVVMNGAVGDSAMQTIANGGIPAAVATTIDPVIIKQLFAPMTATEIYPEVRKGEWAIDTVQFPRTEEAYNVVAYDDYSKNGSVGLNMNWENRKNVRFQTFNKYGDYEQARYGLAMIPYIAMKQAAAIDAINRFHNTSYMYGISGANNFGIINDPALPTPLTPDPDANGKTKWSEKTDAIAIYNDVVKMITQLLTQSNGLIKTTDKIKMVVGPTDNGYLTKVNQTYGTMTAWQRIKESYPAMELVVAPEFSEVVGGLVQLIAVSVGGQQVGICAPSEKMRAFAVRVDGSYTEQKIAAGTFGAVIMRPLGIVQLTGTN